jgi:hypothetical protein
MELWVSSSKLIVPLCSRNAEDHEEGAENFGGQAEAFLVDGVRIC